ncbi:sodium:alanine symporter family protein [Fusobacterium sp. FSA-380-WT-3A]|uniref:alanine/glycine:cation symporter family protein n=1 Tax=Fusobacterium sp. FSA-380-WT-3A TaxID=2725304 RepID=UPI001476EB5F|nr:sodium:alanine symporter family protein [Fusobacterium sp. FSA-380-WT-3A]NME36090.1 sodium:alanine symporter family protein [Fusobacterium sp. FSA-380-WT-3A]
MENLNLLVQNVSGFVWNKILILLLIGTGVFFTVVLKFIQVRKFGEGYKRAVRGANLNGESAGADGMSSFQSLATAIAAQVGTGNLAGAATAIASGGPGAIFWMWVSAFFGMATVYAEAVLGQLYKKRVEGEIIGGPAYYISEGLGNNKFSKGLAIFFALSCVLALSFMGNAVQANSIASAFSNVFKVNPMYIGLFVAVVSGFIFWGGTQRIASFIEKIVPLMAGLYVGASILIMIFNFSEIIPAFKMIIMGAFNPSSVLGGAAGITVKEAVRYGVARGLFSNEAGMGSTPHAHAVAKVDDPSHQGAVAIITVFIDTFVVLNCTAFVIIMTGGVGSGLTGITLTQAAFNKVLGSWGGVFIAVCLFFFALSTIIGWYYFGVANIKYLFGEKGMNPYKIIVLLFIILGSMAKVDLVWNLSDLFNGLMALPNLVALIALYKLVKNVAIENKNK